MYFAETSKKVYRQKERNGYFLQRKPPTAIYVKDGASETHTIHNKVRETKETDNEHYRYFKAHGKR
jgi:hypothetical protein